MVRVWAHGPLGPIMLPSQLLENGRSDPLFRRAIEATALPARESSFCSTCRSVAISSFLAVCLWLSAIVLFMYKP